MQNERKFEVYEQELISPLGGREMSHVERVVADVLLKSTRERPATIKQLINWLRDAHRIRTNDRAIKDVIRALRKDHALPIIASRGTKKKDARQLPGYWYAQSAEEMKGFIETFSRQARDEFHTLGRMVRHNFPELAGQLVIEAAGQLVGGNDETNHEETRRNTKGKGETVPDNK